MTQERRLTTDRQPNAELMEKVVIEGDLSNLSAPQRVSYYKAVCESLGLNPLTKPFSYIRLNGKMVLYAQRDCTDQLRNIHSVSVTITSRETMQGVYVVSARATMPNGRSDESIGAVTTEGLKGEVLANAMMKAETKSKRRVTLSIVGLGWLDETEVTTVPDVQTVVVDDKTGEIVSEGPRPSGADTRLVTEPQLKRLHALMREHGVPSDTARAYVKANYRKESSKELTRTEYDDLGRWIQSHKVESEAVEEGGLFDDAEPSDMPLGR